MATPAKESWVKKTTSRFRSRASEAVSVSFLPSAMMEEPKVLARRRAVLGGILFSTIMIPLLIAGIVFLLVVRQQRSKAVIESKISETENILNQSESSLAIARGMGKKITAGKFILAHHLKWSSLLAFLGDNTVPEISYRSMTADRRGGVVLEATAKDYDSIARAIAIFSSNTMIKAIKTSGMSARTDVAGGGGVDVTFSITFAPEIFTFKGL